MATGLYALGRNAFLSAMASGGAGGAIDFLNSTICAILVHNSAGGTSYTPNLATDQFYSSIPSGAIVAGSVSTVALASKTATAGWCSCANIVFSAVTGVQVDAIVIFRSTGTTTTSNLIAYIDSSGATGLPVTPNGSSITLNVPATIPGLFML